MTDWGAHHFGGATFAIDVRELEPVEVIYHDDKEGKYLTYRYPNGVLLYHNHPKWATCKSSARRATNGSRSPCPPTRATAASTATSSHAARRGRGPSATSSWRRHTVAVCHLGIIAYELKRSLKWDSAKQEFPGDAEANRLIDRARREPWVL